MKLRTAAILAFSLATGPCWALGAVAIGEPSDVAKEGYSAGISYNFKTPAEAEDRAYQECSTVASVSAETRKLCKIVRTFEHQCAAIALDPAAGTPGAGWAVAESLLAARREAVQRCEETAGTERRGECRVSAEGCDGKAK